MRDLFAVGAAVFTFAACLERNQREIMAPAPAELEEACSAAIAELKTATGPFHSQAGGTLGEDRVAEAWEAVAELRILKRRADWGHLHRRLSPLIHDLQKALLRYERSVQTGFVIGARAPG